MHPRAFRHAYPPSRVTIAPASSACPAAPLHYILPSPRLSCAWRLLDMMVPGRSAPPLPRSRCSLHIGTHPAPAAPLPGVTVCHGISPVSRYVTVSPRCHGMSRYLPGVTVSPRPLRSRCSPAAKRNSQFWFPAILHVRYSSCPGQPASSGGQIAPL